MRPAQRKGFWVGIDLAKQTLEAAVAPNAWRPEQWAKLQVRSFANSTAGIDQLRRWVQEQAGRCEGICVESTGVYSRRLQQALAAAGLKVAIVNPARPQALARSLGVRDKSDRVDAAVLAVYGAMHRPRGQRAATRAQQRLRDLWRLREDLIDDRTRVRQRLEQAEDTFVARQLKMAVGNAQRAVVRVEAEIERVVASDQQLREDTGLLQTIPGMGKISAWLLLAELGDLRQWRRKELVGYAGLFPREYSSGTSVRRRPRLARGGGRRLRCGLFMVAFGIRGRPGVMREFSQRLVEAGKSRMSAIGALMRKVLLVARAVVISGQAFDPTRIGPRAG